MYEKISLSPDERQAYFKCLQDDTWISFRKHYSYRVTRGKRLNVRRIESSRIEFPFGRLTVVRGTIDRAFTQLTQLSSIISLRRTAALSAGRSHARLTELYSQFNSISAARSAGSAPHDDRIRSRGRREKLKSRLSIPIADFLLEVSGRTKSSPIEFHTTRLR